jgi:diguanylate cyclase (GGDEF)-like protein/PAS domain S-box-containing protein
MIENISDTVSILDADGTLRTTTGQLKEVLGYPPSWWESRSVFDLAHPDDLAAGLALFEAIKAAPLGTEMTRELRARHADGSWAVIETTGVNLLEDPDLGGIVLTTRNVTKRWRTETLLASQATALEQIARSAGLDQSLAAILRVIEDPRPDAGAAVYLLDAQGAVALGAVGSLPRTVAEAFTSEREGHGGPWADLMRSGEERLSTDPVGDQLPGADLLAERGYQQVWTVPIVEAGRNEVIGAVLVALAEANQPGEAERSEIEVAATLTAVAVERRRAEDRLAHQAQHDALTGLPNRTLLMERLDSALQRSGPQRLAVAVLFLDVDRFKVINDSLGHSVGDQLLVTFSGRLLEAVRPEDTVARFGGDEFVVVLEDVSEIDEVRRIAGRVEDTLAEPFQLGESEVVLTSSIGIALGHASRDTPDTVLRNADTAMYRAKELGRDRTVLFDDDLRERAVSRLLFENDLRRAIGGDELVVHYQPSVDLATGRINGVEALVRWDHPRRDLIPPEAFLELAAETGLIVPLGRMVLERAVADAAGWALRHPELGDILMAVNLSARQLAEPDLAAQVQGVLDEHHWPVDRLALELTETELLDENDTNVDALGALRALSATGVRLCVDDFGTGYSSLSYLHRFPMDIVKIDRSFVASIGVEPTGVAIANGVVGMAHALGQVAVAEGIETSEQLQVLRDLGCDWGQGFLFSEPLPAGEIEALMVERRVFEL